MKLKCEKCGYIWDYNGKSNYYATCPMCMHKVKVNEYKREIKHAD